MTNAVTLELMQRIDQVFADHNVDGIVASFAPDGVFDNAIGPEVLGARYAGHAEIRSFYETLFASASDVKWAKTDIRISGNKVYAEWLRTATTAEGVKQAWQGMDIYTFRDGLIIKKDTYIKVVSPENAT